MMKIVWSDAAYQHLSNIIQYIAEDSPSPAKKNLSKNPKDCSRPISFATGDRVTFLLQNKKMKQTRATSGTFSASASTNPFLKC
jgi:hypothetical protein